jgi:hypothetical protein
MTPTCQGCAQPLACTNGVWYCTNFKCRRRGLTVQVTGVQK